MDRVKSPVDLLSRMGLRMIDRKIRPEEVYPELDFGYMGLGETAVKTNRR